MNSKQVWKQVCLCAPEESESEALDYPNKSLNAKIIIDYLTIVRLIKCPPEIILDWNGDCRLVNYSGPTRAGPGDLSEWIRDNNPKFLFDTVSNLTK